jgi:hypothetical protein
MASTYTYDDNARREDLLDIITNLDYKENQLMSGLGRSTAKDILHQWLTDTLKTPGHNAFVESVDASYADRTDPSRLTNYCQIVRIGFDVSDTERAVNNAGFNDRYTYETQKALKEFKQDFEFALMRGSLVCGSGSSARQMKGIKNWFTSHNVTNQSGVSLSESLLNDRLQADWDDGTEINALYVSMYHKRKISGFTAGATKNVETTDRRLVNAVDVYEADAAKLVKLFAHRFVKIAGTDYAAADNADVVGINEDMFKIAWLTGREPKVRELAKTGDASKGEVVGEGTLECLHEDAGFVAQGML